MTNYALKHHGVGKKSPSRRPGKKRAKSKRERKSNLVKRKMKHAAKAKRRK